ncbi:sensor histidine kinase [Flexivirga caeni]|uniref:sensor histidine kinase n=1 Tax=Flexivirga caeni TaxID=2294115 RepID=UPI0013155815|nr:histidine kinase [Flexivirga caeni]
MKAIGSRSDWLSRAWSHADSRARATWGRWRHQRWFAAAVEACVVGVAAVDAIPYRTSGASDWTWSLLAVAGLLVRKRWSTLSWAACLPGLLSTDVVVAPLVAVFSVADRARRSWVVVVVVLGTFAAQLVGFLNNGFASGEIARLQDIVYSAVFAAGPAAAGLLAQARRRISVQLQELMASHQREQELATTSVLAEERTRLAREMHDVVSHQVSLVALQAGAWQVTTTSERDRQQASTIRVLAVRTLDELRAMVGVLRGSSELELEPQPRLADLQRLVVDSGTGAQLHWDTDRSRPWPEAVERAAYRSVQEGLTNVRKHAPGAPVTVSVHGDLDSLTVQIRNGPPPDGTRHRRNIPGGGHGLVGLRERAELLHGSLHAGPTSDGGYTLTVTLRHPPA